MILALLIGLAAGFVGSIAGGGGFISIPGLLLLGISPSGAVATTKFGALGLSAGGLWGYRKKVSWNVALVLLVCAVLGALLGTHVLLALPEEILKKAMGALLLLVIPFMMQHESFGVRRQAASFARKTVGTILYLPVMAYGAFLGAGGGAASRFVLMEFFGMDMIEASATEQAPWLVMTILSVMIYAGSGIIDYRAGIFVLAGMLVGSLLGSKLAIRKGAAWAKAFYAMIGIAVGVWLLL